MCDAPGTLFQSTTSPNGCGQSICHAPGVTTPDLVSPNVWARLVSQPETLSPACVGMSLVNPAKPAGGVLFRRLTGSDCGLWMPLGSTATNQPILDCITSWVTAQLPP